MSGIQFWVSVAFLAVAAWAVRRDRTVWSKLPDRANAQRPAGWQYEHLHKRWENAPTTDAWLDDVQAWGDELDGTAQLRRDVRDLARANVYATVSADVAAQQARVRGEVA